MKNAIVHKDLIPEEWRKAKLGRKPTKKEKELNKAWIEGRKAGEKVALDANRDALEIGNAVLSVMGRRFMRSLME